METARQPPHARARGLPKLKPLGLEDEDESRPLHLDDDRMGLLADLRILGRAVQDDPVHAGVNQTDAFTLQLDRSLLLGPRNDEELFLGISPDRVDLDDPPVHGRPHPEFTVEADAEERRPVSGLGELVLTPLEGPFQNPVVFLCLGDGLGSLVLFELRIHRAVGKRSESDQHEGILPAVHTHLHVVGLFSCGMLNIALCDEKKLPHSDGGTIKQIHGNVNKAEGN